MKARTFPYCSIIPGYCFPLPMTSQEKGHSQVKEVSRIQEETDQRMLPPQTGQQYSHTAHSSTLDLTSGASGQLLLTLILFLLLILLCGQGALHVGIVTCVSEQPLRVAVSASFLKCGPWTSRNSMRHCLEVC